MTALKNFIVGFLVSFAGSIPLGYLNIIGYEIFAASGLQPLLLFLAGVVLIEAVVIYLTLAFAEKISENKALSRVIDIFTIFFLLVLAAAFYVQPEVSSTNEVRALPSASYFVVGIIMSALNFIQIPFWTGWNLYLVNSNLISIRGIWRYLYLFGTLAGTFSGMILLIMALSKLSENYMPKLLISNLVPLFFLLIAVYNIVKYYRKYYIKAH